MTISEFHSAINGFTKVSAAEPKVCILGKQDYEEFKLMALDAKKLLPIKSILQLDPPRFADIPIYEGIRSRGITFGA